MMRRRHEFTDEQWERIAPLLPGKPGDPEVTADNRLLINAQNALNSDMWGGDRNRMKATA